MLKLRDYQENAVQDIRNSYIAGKRAPLLVLPTGGGKTVVFSYIGATTAARQKRVIVLVHRVELLRQTSAKLLEAGVSHGLVNPLFTPSYRESVQVASVQSLVRRLQLVDAPDLIIIDEAHHATAGTWRKIIEAFPRARLLGVTATPIRSDGDGLGVESGGLFDDLIIGPQVAELIERGYLVKPIIFAPTERIDLRGVRTVRGDYDQQELEQRVDKPQITGHAVEHYRRFCDGAPAVAFCISVAHAQHVADEFRAAGYRSAAVDGSMEDGERKRILTGLGTGEIQVVTSCDLISEGTDIPAIACAILLRPTQSLGLYLQQVGRALRPCEGKDRAIILDHVGNVLMHGLPDEPREWSLDGEEKKTRKKNEEKKVRVKQCERCFVVHEPAPVCPNCGFIYESKSRSVETVEGELKEITPEQRAALRKQQRSEVGRAKTLEELERVERQRGYKPGWAKHVWGARNKKAVGI
jgi:superfamily II DNA or RNA helicase